MDEGTCEDEEISNETGLTDYRVEVETLQKIMRGDSRSSYGSCSRDHRVGAVLFFRSVVLWGGTHIPQIVFSEKFWLPSQNR